MSVKSMDEIASFLETLKLKKKILGGVDEDGVWQVIDRLQKDYRSLLDATEQRYSAVLDERNQIIFKLKTENRQLKSQNISDEGSFPNG